MALVDRSGRTAVLTPPGRCLAEHAQDVLAALEAAEAEVTALAQPAGALVGDLTIATIPTLGRALLPPVLEHLTAAAPQLTLRIEQLEPEDSLPALARGDLDLALAGEFSLTPRRLPAAVRRHDLFTEPMYVAVPADHPQPGPTVALSTLQEDRWISPATGSSCAVLLERSCATAGFEPHVVAHCADFDLAAAFTAAGHGITLIPAIAAPTALTSLGAARTPVRLLTAQEPSIRRTLYAATRHGAAHHPPIAALLALLAEHALALSQ